MRGQAASRRYGSVPKTWTVWSTSNNNIPPISKTTQATETGDRHHERFWTVMALSAP
jgi:hypothetical protein